MLKYIYIYATILRKKLLAEAKNKKKIHLIIFKYENATILRK